nr:hypothetical protein [Tanacetum cinerariifolium]
DSDLHLTPVVHSSSSTQVKPSSYTLNPVTIIPGPMGIVQLSSSTRVEPSPSTQNLVRIIPGPAGIVQQANLLKERDILLGWDEAVMSTQEYMQKVVEDDDFNSRKWVSPTNYVNAFGGTVTGCLGDIKNNLKRKNLNKFYGKDIIVAAAMILVNVSVFTPKPSQHYLNITMRNVIEVFCKDTVLGSGSG